MFTTSALPGVADWDVLRMTRMVSGRDARCRVVDPLVILLGPVE